MKRNIMIIGIIISSLLVLSLISLIFIGAKMGPKLFKNFNMSNAVVIKDKSYDLNEIENIKISLTSSDVKFIETDNEQLRVVQYSEKDGKNKFIDDIDNSIEIKEKQNFCFIFCMFDKSYYEIYIPKKYNQELYLKTVSGDMKIDNLNTKTTIRQTSGDISINNVTGPFVEIKTVSGDIKVNSIEADSIKLKTTRGDISIKNIVSNKMSASSESGSINITNLFTQASVKTTRGEIEINNLDVKGNSKFESVSGDIDIVNSEVNDCKFELKTVSGDKNTENGTKFNNGKYEVNIKTTRGDIYIK